MDNILTLAIAIIGLLAGWFTCVIRTNDPKPRFRLTRTGWTLLLPLIAFTVVKGIRDAKSSKEKDLAQSQQTLSLEQLLTLQSNNLYLQSLLSSNVALNLSRMTSLQQKEDETLAQFKQFQWEQDTCAVVQLLNQQNESGLNFLRANLVYAKSLLRDPEDLSNSVVAGKKVLPETIDCALARAFCDKTLDLWESSFTNARNSVKELLYGDPNHTNNLRLAGTNTGTGDFAISTLDRMSNCLAECRSKIDKATSAEECLKSHASFREEIRALSVDLQNHLDILFAYLSVSVFEANRGNQIYIAERNISEHIGSRPTSNAPPAALAKVHARE